MSKLIKRVLTRDDFGAVNEIPHCPTCGSGKWFGDYYRKDSFYCLTCGSHSWVGQVVYREV